MPMSLLEPVVLIVLSFVLLMACVCDLRSQKIPNLLTGPMLVVAFVLHGFLDGWQGLQFAGLGMLTGFACLFPGYLFKKVMGAGDVKLMAVIGAFIGYKAVFFSSVFTIIAGGVLALLYMAMQGGLYTTLRRYMTSVRLMTYFAPMEGEVASMKFPYALAIAAGVVLQFWYFTSF